MPFPDFRQCLHVSIAKASIIFELEPGRHELNFIQCYRRFSEHQVLFLMAITWMHEAQREGSIIGKKQQPFAIKIQPAHRKQPIFSRHQIGCQGASLWVAERSDITTRLV